jgi:hypothetical protein
VVVTGIEEGWEAFEVFYNDPDGGVRREVGFDLFVKRLNLAWGDGTSIDPRSST